MNAPDVGFVDIAASPTRAASCWPQEQSTLATILDPKRLGAK
ncbi:MAG TPA: hypothetical protein VGR76_22895 [Candidatus Angelobacter sp.]|nr:hypothetical protein [Candidatus Angelobacter sp.]